MDRLKQSLEILKQTKKCNDEMIAEVNEKQAFGEAFDIAIKSIEQQIQIKRTFCTLEEIVARNIIAWETSKDKSQGLLPEIYNVDRVLFEQLTGEAPTWLNLHKYAKLDK